MSESTTARLSGMVHVGLVVLEAEGVDDQDVEVLKEVEGFLGNRFDVGKVGEGFLVWAIKAESVSANPAVFDFDRCDFEPVELEGVLKGAGIRVDVATVFAFVEERPGKHAVKPGESFGGAVEWERTVAAPAEGADFIEARDMVDMFVGVEDRIDSGDVFAEGLFVEIGTGVYEEAAEGTLNDCGASEATVVGVIRSASGAGAAYDRHTNRGGGAQKKEAALIRTRAHGCNWVKALHNHPLIAKRNAHSSQDS